ncbi:MAG: hypothetical protein M1831_004277 [Alyxoria varia]|nr:MAG: hypothetical protein M1831_004277 [Alyxoria varia]
MSHRYSLGEQQELFDIPRPIDPSTGRTWSTSVHAFSRNGQKRKRAEIAVATDGESINLYNIKNPKLLTSHALPPQAYLQASPCCIYNKGSRSKPASRIIYAAIRNELDPSEHHIQGFHDLIPKFSGESSTSQAVPENFHATLGSDGDHVVFIDTIAASTRRDVLCIQKSGQVTALSEDLKTVKWTSHAANPVDAFSSQPTSGTVLIKHAFMCDVATAARGFLRCHPEVLATLAPVDHADAYQHKNTQVLILITHPTSGNETSRFALSVYGIRPSHLISSNRSALQHLIRWDSNARFPTSESASRIEYFFDVKLGTLQQLVDNKLVVYSFTESEPRHTACIEQSQYGTTSLLPISGYLSLLSSPFSVCLVDVRFNSIHATRCFDGTTSAKLSRKRKRSHHSYSLPEPESIQLIQYLPKAGAVIGTLQSKMICFQLNVPSQIRGASAGKPQSLMQCIGQSFDPEVVPKSQYESQNEQDAKMFDALHTLQACARKRDYQEYIHQFFKRVDRSNSLDAAHLHLVAIHCAGQMFDGVIQSFTLRRANEHDPKRIERPFVPKPVFRWLAIRGYISPRYIETALNSDSASQYKETFSVSSQNLVDAISVCDPTLVLLSDVLDKPFQLGLPGTVQALACILQSFESLKPIKEDRLLMSGPKADGIDEDDFPLQQEQARIELELATELLEDGMRPRALALKKCLDSLTALYSPSEIALSLRSHMKQQHLMLLVELLRFELSGGGWTSKILDFAPVADSGPGQDGAIHSICILLNCSMDALGAGGWLLGTSGSVDVNNSEAMVTFLRNETGSVLEGVQESIFIQAFLQDFLRYENLVKASSSDKRKRFKSSLGSDSALPIGRKVAHEISDTRIGAGGEIQMRSKRDIGKKASQKLGKYTLEHLDI